MYIKIDTIISILIIHSINFDKVMSSDCSFTLGFIDLIRNTIKKEQLHLEAALHDKPVHSAA
jgi:hypothetical protein